MSIIEDKGSHAAWRSAKLKEVVALQRGHDLTDAQRREGDVPVMSAAGQYGFHDTALVKGPGLVIGRSGASIGQVHFCDRDFWPHNTALYVTSFHRNDPRFIFYFLQSLELSRYNTGGAQPSLNRNFIYPLDVIVPERNEQRAIAAALSDVDELIEALDKLIAKKRAIKLATMQQLLTGKTRLLGFSGEWTTTTLGEVVDIKNGGTPSTQVPSYWNGTIPWCTPTDLTSRPGKYLTATDRCITPDGLAHCGATLLPAGSLLLCSRATIGEVKIAATEVCTNQGFKSLVCRNGVFHEWLYYLVLTLKPQLIERAIGSTFLEISKRAVAAIEIVIPHDEEQRAIARVLSDMDAEITALEQRRDKTKAIKQGMMQSLLTGRVRLVEPENARVNAASRSNKGHNWAFNEAVVIATLAKQFGSEQYPLGRKRYTKLSYLLHRHAEKRADGYLKKAAGPYNPKTKYGGPEKIAIEKRYVREQQAGKYTGFVAAEAISEAERYFEKWYGSDATKWLNQFRFVKNDELEVLATVDMAAEELRTSGKSVTVAGVKDIIRDHTEWTPKLDRQVFSDKNIAKAIESSQKLFE